MRNSNIDLYGNGVSTGLDQTALGRIATGLTPQDVILSAADKSVLQRLGERVASLAGTAEMEEKRRLWKGHNALAGNRPLVFCDPENGWNEIITDDLMECTGRLARRWEMDLRKEIFWGEEMGDDRPVEASFVVPYTVLPDDWGLKTVFHHSELADGAQSWEGPLQDYDRDFPKLRAPRVQVDWETTRGCLALAREAFGTTLDVQLQGTWWWSLGLTLPAVMLRGLTNLLMDFAAQPDELKALLSFVSNAHLQKLDELEREGLLSLNNNGTYVGSGGFGYTDELPGSGFDGHVRCRDLWGFAESQETVCVSPDMYAAYVFPYEQPILARFGLNCYGCCEALDARWQTVKRHHNLRRVSCSPWADLGKMAACLENKYILSLKPNPVELACEAINEEQLRAGLRRALEITRGCVVEIIMKDNHTISKRPEHVTRWCRIAKEEALRAGGE
jgi:hypothetical protein